MSRSGYCEMDSIDSPEEQWALLRWRGAVRSAIGGKRGQALLREMAEALDAMPVKELIADKLVDGEQVCALGAVAVKRGIDVAGIDPEDRDAVAAAFNIAPAMAAEIAFINDDEYGWHAGGAPARWRAVRGWVARMLRGEKP